MTTPWGRISFPRRASTLHKGDSNMRFYPHCLRSHLIKTAANKITRDSDKKMSAGIQNPADTDLAHLSPPRLPTRDSDWCENRMARQGMGRALIEAALKNTETDSRKRWVLHTMAGMFPGRTLLHEWNLFYLLSSRACYATAVTRQTATFCVSLGTRLEAACTAAHH
jgi:hypothetical protein